MQFYSRARVNYCSHLGANVVFACRDESADDWECMNKSDCGFDECGCRNLLIRQSDKKTKSDENPISHKCRN